MRQQVLDQIPASGLAVKKRNPPGNMFVAYMGILGMYWDNGKENGNCHLYFGPTMDIVVFRFGPPSKAVHQTRRCKNGKCQTKLYCKWRALTFGAVLGSR